MFTPELTSVMDELCHSSVFAITASMLHAGSGSNQRRYVLQSLVTPLSFFSSLQRFSRRLLTDLRSPPTPLPLPLVPLLSLFNAAMAVPFFPLTDLSRVNYRQLVAIGCRLSQLPSIFRRCLLPEAGHAFAFDERRRFEIGHGGVAGVAVRQGRKRPRRRQRRRFLFDGGDFADAQTPVDLLIKQITQFQLN